MNSRDKILLVSGSVIGLSGIVLALVWRNPAGIIALLMMNLVILLFLFSQRRQLARLQKKTDTLLNSRLMTKESTATGKPLQSQEVPLKKVVGLLQAQQISMERLNDKMDGILNQQHDEDRSSI